MKNRCNSKAFPVPAGAKWWVPPTIGCAVFFCAVFLLSGCGGRSFGFPECEEDTDCPEDYCCGTDGFCAKIIPSSDSADTDTDTETDTTDDSDTLRDSATASDDTDSWFDSDSPSDDTGSGIDSDTSDSETTSGSGSDIETDSDSEIDTVSDTETDTTTDSGTHTSTDSGIDTDTGVDTATDTGTDTGTDSDTATDSAIDTSSASESESGSEPDTETASETDTGEDTEIPCPLDCLFYITCSSIGGVEVSGYSCDGGNEVCCDTTPDTDSDSETDSTTTDGDCLWLCVSAWACEETYSGTVQWDYICDSFPSICCQPYTDIDTDSDTVDTATDTDTATETDSDTDSGPLCPGTPPTCLEDQSILYNSLGCCAYWSAAAVCQNNIWKCPTGYREQSECVNFAPDCPVIAPEGCGFEYPVFYPAGDNISAVATGHMDTDSELDVVATSFFDGGFSILYGNGDGTFSDAVLYDGLGNQPAAVRLADINADGFPDVFIAFREDNQTGVFISNGDGTFQDKLTVAEYSDPYDLLVEDMNGDGVPDIVTASNSSDDPQIRIHLAEVMDGAWSGAFEPFLREYMMPSPTGLASGDFDNDGTRDLAIVCNLENQVRIELGDGDGTFTFVSAQTTGSNPIRVTVADIDSDGNDDILVGNEFSDNISLWYGNGDGTFGMRQDYDAGDGANAVVVTLFNNDLYPDLVVANWQDDSLSILFGGVDTETDSDSETDTDTELIFVGTDNHYAGDAPSRPMVIDLNGDGVPDAIVGSRGDDAVSVMIGYCDE